MHLLADNDKIRTSLSSSKLASTMLCHFSMAGSCWNVVSDTFDISWVHIVPLHILKDFLHQQRRVNEQVGEHGPCPAMIV